MNRQKKEQLKRKMQRINDGCVTTKTITTTNEIGSLRTTFIPTLNTFDPFAIIKQSQALMAQSKQQEKNMYFSEDTQDYQARNRLYSRALDATHDHERRLRDVYHLNDTDTSNWSQEDAVQAIKDGKFVFRRPDEAKKPGHFYYCGLEIRYRDPEKPADELGFRNALKKVHETLETVVDHIAVSEPKEAMKKGETYREQKFH